MGTTAMEDPDVLNEGEEMSDVHSDGGKAGLETPLLHFRAEPNMDNFPLLDFPAGTVSPYAASRLNSSDSQAPHLKWGTAQGVPAAVKNTREIIGTLRDEDPYKDHPPRTRPYGAYNPRNWLSVPMSAWIPDLNWTLFGAVIFANAAVTTAIHIFSRDDEECSLYGLCGSGLTLDHSSHSTLGLALFLLLTFRVRSSYDKFWEGRKLWGLTVSHFNVSCSLSARLLLLRVVCVCVCMCVCVCVCARARVRACV